MTLRANGQRVVFVATRTALAPDLVVGDDRVTSESAPPAQRAVAVDPAYAPA
jgi:hypothetical protein